MILLPAMSESVCYECRGPKANLRCGICEESLCKKCARFLDEQTFSFRTQLAPELSHTYYCSPCFDAQVEPELAAYDETMDRAKEAFFFFVTHKGGVPVEKRALKPVEVESCPDRDETILRLAFRAAENGFNAVMDAEVKAEKVRTGGGGYQKSRWMGKGIPALVDAERLNRRFED